MSLYTIINNKLDYNLPYGVVTINLDTFIKLLDDKKYGTNILKDDGYLYDLLSDNKTITLDNIKFNHITLNNYSVIYTVDFTDAWFFRDLELIGHKSVLDVGGKLFVDLIPYCDKVCYLWKSENGQVYDCCLYDIKTNSLVKKYDLCDNIVDFQISPDKKWLVGKIWIWGPYEYAVILNLETEKRIIYALDLNNYISFINPTNTGCDVIHHKNNIDKVLYTNLDYNTLYEDTPESNYIIKCLRE
jgi:hypothetical protein